MEHRKTKLEQQYWLYQLKKDVDELEKWITEREAVATSTELGHDLEDVTVSALRLTPHISSLNLLLRNIRFLGHNYKIHFYKPIVSAVLQQKDHNLYDVTNTE